jgi:hypothetical protein
MPQPKKDASVRARANKASTRATLNAEHKVAAPPLPAGRDWLPATCEWWADLWASPMAGEYHNSDKHALFILAALVDEFWTSPTKDLAGEIRLQRQAFGLTPYDRRRLEWTIEQTDEAQDRGRQRRSRTGAAQPRVGADPRSVLHAV